MRREKRESSYCSASDLDDIEQIKRNIRESSTEKHESSYEERSRSYLSRKDVMDLERRYSRGKSEERYPHEYRGRSLSPRRDARHPRSTSVLAERHPSYARSLSPIRETAQTKATQEKIKAISEETAQTLNALKKANEDLAYFVPRYYYPYYRPYYRLSPSEISDIIAQARINARRYLTPRPLDFLYTRPYYSRYLFSDPEIKEPTKPVPTPSPTTFSAKTESFTSSLYNPSKFRSFYTYPNLQYTRTFLPRHYYM